jgi:hypothetical protein
VHSKGLKLRWLGELLRNRSLHNLEVLIIDSCTRDTTQEDYNLFLGALQRHVPKLISFQWTRNLTRLDNNQRLRHKLEGLQRLQKLYLDFDFLIFADVYDLETLLSHSRTTYPGSLQHLVLEGSQFLSGSNTQAHRKSSSVYW